MRRSRRRRLRERAAEPGDSRHCDRFGAGRARGRARADSRESAASETGPAALRRRPPEAGRRSRRRLLRRRTPPACRRERRATGQRRHRSVQRLLPTGQLRGRRERDRGDQRDLDPPLLRGPGRASTSRCTSRSTCSPSSRPAATCASACAATPRTRSSSTSASSAAGRAASRGGAAAGTGAGRARGRGPSVLCEHMFVIEQPQSAWCDQRSGRHAWPLPRLASRSIEPSSEHAKADLVFGLGRRLFRVQCKTARQHGDALIVRLVTSRRTALRLPTREVHARAG